MNYEAIIDKYYPEDDALRRLLLKHSRQVADRCLLVARRHPELPLDVAFLEEAAMLHDIGIRWCHAPGIFCQGTEHYIRHGLIGAELLRREGLERHARVCERHTGTGITQEQIARQRDRRATAPRTARVYILSFTIKNHQPAVVVPAFDIIAFR